MSKYKVLIDSSVWIEYFKNGGLPKLDLLIEEGLACTNDLILTELGPALVHQKESEVFQDLLAIEKIHLSIDWEIIREYQLINLQHGINKVGIPDLIIVQQVIAEKITLCSFDKHFKLMQDHLTFELFEV
ncbi:PIN domain-containing protein [Gracilimonas mengyeensis]|uniref:PIN domain-containing protein n=1 Tax=Gracilimonas mengyeensis TaxID=1302730 RepID=A0A521EGK0_9BACT|nr:PIN domain-containing protein [Gracilimonas mengyeensis]SMO83057.1 hypothetical protein SAMN06265219_11228 [Gracilimonas mengyeensis]